MKFVLLFLQLNFLFFSNFIFSQEKKSFSNLEELLTLAKEKSFVFKNAQEQIHLANLTKKTAIGNVINPRIPASIQSINNLKQQVIFLPGEPFGQPAGTIKEVTTGQQYVSIFSIQPQFEIINFGAIGLIKSAKINEEIVENQNKIDEQKIYNQINTVYFNILTYQGQKEILKENITLAKKILSIVNNRYKAGITKKQDLNDAEVNLISIENNLLELENNLSQQYLALSTLFEDEINSTLVENVWQYQNTTEILETNNQLDFEHARLQWKNGQQERRLANLQNLPIVSFISSFNWQNVSNQAFFDSTSNWINFNYIGFRLSWDFPTTVVKLSNIYNQKIKNEIFKNSFEHAKKENELKNKQLSLDYQKSVATVKNMRKIFDLKLNSFEKNQNQYNENILGLDKLLLSQKETLDSKLNLISSLAQVGFYKHKILINNKF